MDVLPGQFSTRQLIEMDVRELCAWEHEVEAIAARRQLDMIHAVACGMGGDEEYIEQLRNRAFGE